MAKRKRGRESVRDMVRSLGLVLLIVVAVFFFARAPHSDEKKIRVVDPTSDVQAFSVAVPGGAVPRTMPTGWKPTVTQYDRDKRVLRVGWNTPAGNYAEYAAAPHAPHVPVRHHRGGAAHRLGRHRRDVVGRVPR